VANSIKKKVFVFKNKVILLLILISTSLVIADTNNSPIGVWLTIDDNTHKPTALIQIYEDYDGDLNAKVLKGLRSGDSPDRRCTECPDERKNQKIKGMVIMKHMKYNGNQWDGGKILDPVAGTEYSCKIYLDNDGRKLVVLGYIGFPLLGRTQVWTRQNASNE
jgi:uncharacterized protein (DUF2147 family)